MYTKVSLVRFIIVLLVIWRLFVFLVAFVSIKFIPARIEFLGGGYEQYFRAPLYYGWANFDGVHYLKIARDGYYQYSQAFFPLYPSFIRYLGDIIGNNLIAGLLISHFALVLAFFLLYRLIILDYNEKIARKTLIFLLLFPTSFFLGSVYTESLFLFLIVGSFFAARKKSWLIAGLLGGLASATRVVGIFLLPALLVEFYQQKNKFTKKDFKNVLFISLSAAGFIFYMYYLHKTLNDPLYFLHMQPLFGAGRTGGKIILLYQVFWRYFRMILTTRMDILYYTVWLEFITGIGFLFLAVITYLKTRLSYLTFFVLAFLAPTITGTFSSLPRYVLVLFPAFIVLALISEKYKWVSIVYTGFCLIALVAGVMLFFRGYFVA